MVEGGMTCVKYILGVFNFVFVIFGILLIVLGWKSLDSASSIEKVIETPNTAAVLCIVIGVILFAIAFMGCCGALRENHCMLITFSVIVLFILIIEFILGGLIIAFKNEVKDLATTGLTKVMKTEYQPGVHNNTYTNFVDELQEKAKCCGVHNASDWTSWNMAVPESCCAKDPKEGNSTMLCTTDNAYKDGCIHAIEDGVKAAFGPLGGVAIAVAIVQLLGVIFACCLAYAVKKEYEVV